MMASVERDAAISGAIPAGWTWARLADIADVVRGVTYRKDQASTEPSEGTVPLLRSGNIQDELVLDDLVYVPADIVDPRQRLQVGDIVVSTSNSKELVGKAAQLATAFDGTFGAFCTVVRPTPAVHARYVGLFFSSPGYLAVINALSAATNNIANIRAGHLQDLDVPLPPIEEQVRIVERVDELSRRIESGTRRLHAAVDGLRALEAALYADALAGRLSARRTWSATASDTRAPLGADHEWPAHWRVARLGELASKVTSGSRDWRPYYGRGTGVFVLTQNVRPRMLDLAKPFNVDPPKDDPARARSLIAKDDLLITIVGANVGNAARVPVEPEEHYVCQSLALVRLTDPRMSRFLELYLAAPQGGQRYFEGCFYGQGRPHISFADLKRMPVPVPPLEEQEEIVRCFHAATASACQFKTQLKTAIRQASLLRMSVTHQAFRGQLASQLPTDTPVDELVARARQEADDRARATRAARKARRAVAVGR